MSPNDTQLTVLQSLRRALRARGGGRELIDGRRLVAIVGAVLLCGALGAAVAAGPGAAQSGDTAVVALEIAEDDRTLIDRQAQHFTAADFDDESIQVINESNPTQALDVTLDVAGDTGTETLVIDYGESAEADLEIANVTIDEAGPLAGAVTDTTVRNDAGELEVTFDTAETGDVDAATQRLTLEWTVQIGVSPPEGDAALSHTATIDGVGDDAVYRLTNRGATAIAPGDAAFDLSGEVLAEDVIPVREGSTGAFRIWQGQDITFQTAENGNEVEIYEYEVESQAGEPDRVVRGDQIDTAGTAPGTVTNYDSTNLKANARYIVDFEGTQESVILDIDPLNLRAESTAAATHVTSEVLIDVESDDIGGGDITTVTFDDEFTFLHEKSHQLDGDGTATVRLDPREDLIGTGDYRVFVVHDESEVATAPVSFSVIDETVEVDAEEPLVLPPEENVNLSGTTTFEAGTELLVEVATEPGSDSPAFKFGTATVEEQPDGPNTWTAALNLSEIESGTNVSISITADGVRGIVTPDGEPVSGTVVGCIDVTGDGECATDTTGDGLLNDVDGNGEFDITDVQVFFQNYEQPVVENNVAAFDFDDDGSISITDVQVLFQQLSG